MRQMAGIFLLLYLVAIHSSMAGMEIFSWSLFLLVTVDRVRHKKPIALVLQWPLLGLIGCVGAGLLLNPALKPPLDQFGFMRWVLLFWMLVWAFEWVWTPEFEKKFVNLWLGACGILAVYALVQFVTGLDLRASRHQLESEGGLFRAAGFFHNCLTFASVMGASYFVIARTAAERIPRPWSFVFLAAGFFAIVASMTRGALFAALVTAFLYLALNHRRLLPYFLGLGVAAVIALSQVWGKLASLIQLRLDGSSLSRMHLWNAYIQMFLDKPLFGVGLFQGDKLLPEYYAREGYAGQFYSHAHNVWIQWLGGAGGPALMLFLFINAMMLVWAWQLRGTKWGWPLLMAQIFLMIGGLSEANFFDGEVNHVNVLIWSMTAFLHRRHVQEFGKI